MAHLFDYSASGTALWNLDADQLFNGINGVLLTASFYGGLPRGSVMILQPSAEDPARMVPVSFDVTLYPEGGIATFDQFDPQPEFTISSSDLGPLPQSLADTSPTTALLDADLFGDPARAMLQFSAIAPIPLPFALPDTVFATQEEAEAAVDAAAAAAFDTLLAGVRSFGATSLADLDGIHAEILYNGFGTGTPDAPEWVLDYTPDPETHLTIGSFLDQTNWRADAPQASAFQQMAETANLFAGENVTLRLTDEDDQMTATGFAARTLTLQLGAGADFVSMDAPAQDSETPQPERIVVHAGDGDDLLEISAVSATLDGQAGDDAILFVATGPGGDGTILSGGLGNDEISGAFADGVVLNGNDGQDTLRGDMTSRLVLNGGAGDDSLVAGFTPDAEDNTDPFTTAGQRMDGGTGNDTLLAGNGSDTLLGGLGDDLILGRGGSDLVIGGTGSDVFEFQIGQFADMIHQIGATTVQDTGGLIDLILGQTMRAAYIRTQDDLMITLTESGHDTPAGRIEVANFFARFEHWAIREGEPGARDTRPIVDLSALASPFSEGDDAYTATVRGTYNGLGGNDTITGSTGADRLEGGDGLDLLIGMGGDDTLIGGTAPSDLADRIFGGDGSDLLDGGYGNDELRGGAGHDTILGGYGVDFIVGGAGEDTMNGGVFSDLMFGGADADFINGGFGSDRLNGGAGADTFFHLGIADHGSDWIQDFTGPQDVLRFGGAANVADFQINAAITPGAGNDATAESFVIHRPTGQILWALVDGTQAGPVTLQLGSDLFELTA